jgi:hypothetical protein
MELTNKLRWRRYNLYNRNFFGKKRVVGRYMTLQQWSEYPTGEGEWMDIEATDIGDIEV